MQREVEIYNEKQNVQLIHFNCHLVVCCVSIEVVEEVITKVKVVTILKQDN